jgi:putative peptidoglycan lipid II flippase
MIEMGKLSFPLLISVGGTELARITDRIFASLLPAGSLSALSFGHRLISAMNNFFIDSLQQATFPHFTKLSAEEKFKKLSSQLFHYLRLVFFVSLPIAIGIMVIAEVIVRVVYQRGAFDETSVRLTSQALFFYAIGFPALVTSRILARTFFGLKDTWTPTKIGLLCMGIKIILIWVLIRPLAHMGIALAESLSEIVKVIFLFFALPDEVKGQEAWSTVKSFGQTLVAAILMGAVIYLVKEGIDGLISIPLEVGALILLGVAFYGVIASVSQAEEFQSLVKALTALGESFLPKRT